MTDPAADTADRARRPIRVLAIMGSGETAPPMARVHRALVARMRAQGAGRGPEGVVLDTPYGFQENADELTARTIEYFRRQVGVGMEVASLRAANPPTTHAAAIARLRASRFVFCGPGSPSYALRVWRESEVPAVLASKLAEGGLLTFASAAALTLGSRTVPVYEIYKVGEAPHWLSGLDLLGSLGLRVAVIPHYDNAEGGTHDTRFCYLGERRLAMLEAELSDEEWILGVDSHTALVLDLEASTAVVDGLGAVTLRVGGRSERLPAGSEVPISELAALAARLRHGASGPPRSQPGPPGPPPSDATTVTGISATPLAAAVAELEARADAALSSGDREAALRAVLELDELLVTWSSDSDGSGDLPRAREAFARLIVRLATTEPSGEPSDPSTETDLVELLVDLRTLARQAGDWATADRIRETLTAHGVELRDGAAGTSWGPRSA